MITDFQQGILTYPTSNNQQVFLSRTGSYVSLSASSSRVDVVFAHGSQNYLFTEGADVSNAWGPLDNTSDYWLYWDINPTTAARTFGFTTIRPVYGTITPPAPVEGLHWFNSTTGRMQVYTSGRFRDAIRVFAAKVNNSTFTPLGTGSKPFGGSQVGLNIANVYVGRILIDTDGKPVKKADGTFFTSESLFFYSGSPVNSVRLEGNVVHATATMNVARFQVVAMSDFEQIRVAEYEDLQASAIALCLSDAVTGETVDLCVQGMVTNQDWNWLQVGAPLWVDDSGTLTTVDPHLTDAVGHPVGRPPIARVFSKTSIYFDQGLGGKGDPGQAIVTNVIPATTSNLGTLQVSVPPTDPATPIAVGTNDPRMTNARTPLPHTHALTSLTDVNVSTPQQADVLSFNSTSGKWQNTQVQTGGGSTTTTLAALTDVAVNATQDSQVLAYNGSLQKWENQVQKPITVSWTQYILANTWVIPHNQGSSNVIISIFDDMGQWLGGSISMVDASDPNNLTISFTDNFRGHAHMVFAPPTESLTSAVDVWLFDTFTGTGTQLVQHVANSGHTWSLTGSTAPQALILRNNWLGIPTSVEDPAHAGSSATFYSSCVVNFTKGQYGFDIVFNMHRGTGPNSNTSYIEFYTDLTFAPSSLLFRIGGEGNSGGNTITTPNSSAGVVYPFDPDSVTTIDAKVIVQNGSMTELKISANGQVKVTDFQTLVNINGFLGIKMYDPGDSVPGIELTNFSYSAAGPQF